jgi:hypothetical protein
MKNEIKYFIYILSLGISLVAYAHATFTTKDDSKSIHEDIRIIQADVKQILRELK